VGSYYKCSSDLDSASEMTYIVSGGALIKLYSLTHSDLNSEINLKICQYLMKLRRM